MARGSIVVGVDGTPSSLDALRFAAATAAKDRDELGLDLLVVHVKRLPWAVSSTTLAPITETVETIAREAEDAAKALLSEYLVTWRWVLREGGDPARELIKVAKQQEARAIAVGGHRHGPLTSALVRSVDTSLVHNYCGTLFIVRPDERPATAEPVPGCAGETPIVPLEAGPTAGREEALTG